MSNFVPYSAAAPYVHKFRSGSSILQGSLVLPPIHPLRQQSYQKTLVAKDKNQTQPASKNQKYLADLYGGEVNGFVLGHYFLDIYFELDKIYCEYDGSGHDLNVQLGQVSKEDFEKREKQRYHILKRNGLKVFRIINTERKEILPLDEELLEIKRIAFEYLKKEKNNYWITFNLNTKIIHTKEKDINWNNIDLKTIKF